MSSRDSTWKASELAAESPFIESTPPRVSASASADHSVKLWDALTGQELRTLRGHTNWVMSMTFAADGQVLASASVDRTVKLWDARTGAELRSLRGHTHRVESVAFAADGQVLASASSDNTVKLWNLHTGQEPRTLRGHTARVTSVAFAADGNTLWSRDANGQVLAWDVATGECPKNVLPPPAFVSGNGAWSPDGAVFAVGRADGRILLVPRRPSAQEQRFRAWVTSPDLHLHRELAESAERDKQSFALAFRLGAPSAAEIRA